LHAMRTNPVQINHHQMQVQLKYGGTDLRGQLQYVGTSVLRTETLAYAQRMRGCGRTNLVAILA
jgi:hypothetical protein